MQWPVFHGIVIQHIFDCSVFRLRSRESTSRTTDSTDERAGVVCSDRCGSVAPIWSGYAVDELLEGLFIVSSWSSAISNEEMDNNFCPARLNGPW